MISTFLIFSLVFYIHLGQVPPHVPPAQNQTLGNQMAEMQGLVQASLNAPVNPVEEPQVPEEPVKNLIWKVLMLLNNKTWKLNVKFLWSQVFLYYILFKS